MPFLETVGILDIFISISLHSSLFEYISFLCQTSDKQEKRITFKQVMVFFFKLLLNPYTDTKEKLYR